ncbi:MAG: hypothetical protein ACK5RL_21430 [Acidimicrobiales bacterium]
MEIGRKKVRAVSLDGEALTVRDVVERPIVTGDGPRDPIAEEYSTRSALESALNWLDAGRINRAPIGVSIGFPNCGVGSGPTMGPWLTGLSEEIGGPILYCGEVGVSYAPADCIEFVHRVFDGIPVRVSRVDLAPVAASRCLGHLPSAALTLGSGVAWSARVLNDNVMEAFETIDGSFDEPLAVLSAGRPVELATLSGVEVEPRLLERRGLTVGTLAPAVGAAIGLLDENGSSLVRGAQQAGTRRPRPSSRVGPIGTAAFDERTLDLARVEPRVRVQSGGPGVDRPLDPGPGPRAQVGLRDRPGPFGLDDLPPPDPRPTVTDTLHLRRVSRPVQRSRELPTSAPLGPRDRPSPVPVSGDLRTVAPRTIEDFAHPGGELQPGLDRIDLAVMVLGGLALLLVLLLVLV